jgi:hypothetical protein
MDHLIMQIITAVEWLGSLCTIKIKIHVIIMVHLQIQSIIKIEEILILGELPHPISMVIMRCMETFDEHLLEVRIPGHGPSV